MNFSINKQTFESMKKNFVFAMMSAIALTGAVSFSACSSNEEIAEEVKVTGETVKTQFAIGITSEANATTRMAEATAQAQVAPVFRGMQDIILIPFDKAPSNTTKRIGGYIVPGDGKIGGTEVSVSNDNHKLTGTANYVVYSDVEVPVGTSHFLFYGHAPAGTFEKGQLTKTVAYTDNTKFVDPQTSLIFTPTSILSGKDDQVAGGNAKGAALITLLNNVATAKATVGTTTDKTWASVTESENNLLYQLYFNFTKLTSGSSFNVHRTLQDLYYSVNNLAGTTDNPYSAIASAIQTAISGACSTTSTDAKTITFKDDYTGYPAVLGLPEGAAKIKWSGTAFVDALKDNTTAGGDHIGATTGTSNATVYSTYAYPADLWYWKSTAIHASNQIESTNFGTKEWEGTGGIIATDYAGDPTVVSGSTKSVALDGQINYAVGRLDLTINALSGTFLDSKLNVMDFSKPYQADASYPTPSTTDTGARNGFNGAITLTGVLIGYQHAVDWQFLPITGTGAKEFVIYDNVINSAATGALSTSAAVGKNYTLVLETPENQIVNIALQFKNEGADFYGKGGQLIPHGGTFYLTGKLNPTVTANTDPSMGDVVSGSLNQVFKQDYYTQVYLTIYGGKNNDTDPHDGIADNPEGLQNATNTIPDLRTTQMELCFSVNLTWNPGLKFDVHW